MTEYKLTNNTVKAVRFTGDNFVEVFEFFKPVIDKIVHDSSKDSVEDKFKFCIRKYVLLSSKKVRSVIDFEFDGQREKSLWEGFWVIGYGPVGVTGSGFMILSHESFVEKFVQKDD